MVSACFMFSVSLDETGCRCGRNSFADLNSSKKCMFCIFSHKTERYCLVY